jgi:hypothetical protein
LRPQFVFLVWNGGCVISCIRKRYFSNCDEDDFDLLGFVTSLVVCTD